MKRLKPNTEQALGEAAQERGGRRSTTSCGGEDEGQAAYSQNYFLDLDLWVVKAAPSRICESKKQALLRSGSSVLRPPDAKRRGLGLIALRCSAQVCSRIQVAHDLPAFLFQNCWRKDSKFRPYEP